MIRPTPVACLFLATPYTSLIKQLHIAALTQAFALLLLSLLPVLFGWGIWRLASRSLRKEDAAHVCCEKERERERERAVYESKEGVDACKL
jgi:hypothetical protein